MADNDVSPVAPHAAYTGNLRNDGDRWTHAERLISVAMVAVEHEGASLHLTNATVLLSQARQAVACHVLAEQAAASKPQL